MQKDSQAIAKRLVKSSRERFTDGYISDFIAGLAYTKVTLEDGRSGLAYSFAGEYKRSCSAFHSNEGIVGKKAKSLIEGLYSRSQFERSLALACINALANNEDVVSSQRDVLCELEIRREDKIAMIGFFAPLVRPLEKACAELKIFDYDGDKSSKLSPLEQMPEILFESDVVLLTSTALLNETAVKVLKMIGKAREVVMLGASTPLIPGVFEDYGVSLLSGVLIKNGAGVSRAVKEGRGMRAFKEFIEKVNLRIKRQ